MSRQRIDKGGFTDEFLATSEAGSPVTLIAWVMPAVALSPSHTHRRSRGLQSLCHWLYQSGEGTIHEILERISHFDTLMWHDSTVIGDWRSEICIYQEEFSLEFTEGYDDFRPAASDNVSAEITKIIG